ncbi:MAG: c-type cytochrome [Chloroflexi bacterium]|nr:c-type cytochrome [Chloroflexota bacterium]
MTSRTLKMALLGLAASTLVLGACAAPPPAAPAASAKEEKPAAAAASGGGAAVAGDANAGKDLFVRKGCIACHVAQGVQGATGTIGPNLNGIGDMAKRPKLADGASNSPEHVREWIKDPQKLKPGTMMPNLQLTDKEADDLTALLMTLK